MSFRVACYPLILLVAFLFQGCDGGGKNLNLRDPDEPQAESDLHRQVTGSDTQKASAPPATVEEIEARRQTLEADLQSDGREADLEAAIALLADAMKVAHADLQSVEDTVISILTRQRLDAVLTSENTTESRHLIEALREQIGNAVVLSVSRQRLFGYLDNTLGLIAMKDGQYANAKEHFEAAAEAWSEQHHDPPVDLPHAINNLGLLAMQLGDNVSAETKFLAAVAIDQDKLRKDDLTHLCNLLQVKRRLGDDTLDDLETLKTRATEFADLETECNALSELGTIRLLDGKLNLAMRFQQEGLKTAKLHFGDDHQRVGEFHVNIGWVELTGDHPLQAKQNFTRAAEVFAKLKSRGEDHPRYREVLPYLARAHVRLGEPEEARLQLLKGVRLQHEHLTNQLNEWDERSQLAMIQKVRLHPESDAWPGALDTLLELAPELEIPVAEQYKWVKRWKNLLRRSNTTEGNGTDRSVLLDFLQYRTRLGVSNGGATSTYVAFVVDKRQANIRRVDLGDLATIDEHIDHLYRQFEIDKKEMGSHPVATPDSYLEPLGDLSKSLSGVLTLVSAEEEVRLSPDGNLHRLPFGMLLTNAEAEETRYWMEDAVLVYANGGSAKGETHEENAPLAAAGFLAIGDVDYSGSEEYRNLKYSSEEIEAVSKLFETQFPDRPTPKRMTGKFATRTAVASELQGPYETVLFSIHGGYFGDNAQGLFELPGFSPRNNCVLVLSGNGNRRFLTAEDVEKLALNRTDLVVLASCESGVGAIAAGQGVFGMVDAFHRAGVNNVVGTLWEVDDQSTSLLIRQFFDNRWRGESTPHALRAAKRKMLSDARQGKSSHLYAHPIFWSALFASQTDR